jgi:hypothetical protein
MAATGFTPIQLYRTTTASAQPSAGNLADGELAINLTDKKLYAKDASNNVFVLADASSGGTTATNLAGGAAGSVPYQTGANATTFLGIGTAAQVLQVNSGATAPEWVNSSGTGNVARTTSPSFTTPSLGAATATSINGLTLTSSTGALTVANGKTLTANSTLTLAGVDGKTLTVNSSLTLTGTDATTMTFPTTSATLARTDAGQTFTGTNVFSSAPQVSTLTSTRVVYAGASGVLQDNANLTFDGTSLTMGGNPTLSAGTANGVLFLNGSKVVTSGSALTFDGTSVFAAPRVRLNNANRLDWGDAGEWIAGDNAGAMIFGVDVNEQMRLTSTGLGIGTSSPTEKLEVSASNAMVKINATGSFAQLGYYNGATFLWNAYADIATGQYRLGNSGGTQLTLDSSGNLGLGVTPSAWQSPFVAFQISTGGAALTGRTDGAQINLSSNWRFGSGTNLYINNGFASRYAQESGGHYWYTAPSGTAGNAISFTQAMTLDASGNFSVGTTTTPSQITFAGSSGITYQRSTDNAFAGVLDYLKSRGSAASPTAVQNNDGLFQLRVAPFQGSAYTYLDSQIVSVDGTFTSGQNPPTRIAWFTNTANGSPTERVRIPAAGGMVVGTAALATAATDGFLYVPTCAGTPTGTPTTQTGTAPIVVDTTNNKLYFYSDGQWRDAGP